MVVFVIVAGIAYIDTNNWFGIPAEARKTSEQILLESKAGDYAKMETSLLRTAEDLAKQYSESEFKSVVVNVKGQPPITITTKPKSKSR